MEEINIRLSDRDINKAIKRLRKYQRKLERKNKLFVERLAEVGIPVINSAMGSGSGDSSRDYKTAIEVTGVGKTVTGFLVIGGTDILFWEFGAGIHYNNGNTNPKAHEFGMGVGTYPGQTHAIDPGYWWYTDDAGKKHLSYGTEATMPMYKASVEIRKQITQIAREVFGSGEQ